MSSNLASREEVVSLIKDQLNFKTQASDNKGTWHYGKCELRELLDFIYGCDPKTTAEEIK